MDPKFHPAIAAIKAGDLQMLCRLIEEDRTLATGRSGIGHPTLLQCLVLNADGPPNKVQMAKALVDAGADLQGPFVACGSCDNAELADFLVDSGAAINGLAGWSPLEEALYWNSRRVIDLLVRRGASISNLRMAAGLGRTDLIEKFFNPDGGLKPEAGTINWPWGDRKTIEASNFDTEGKRKLLETVASWTHDRQGIINNAFVYACMHDHVDAANLLLEKGAEVNIIPGGFDYAGTGLHYAALNGHRSMIDFLLTRGADVSIKDTKVAARASGWADYGGHPEIRDYLLRVEAF